MRIERKLYIGYVSIALLVGVVGLILLSHLNKISLSFYKNLPVSIETIDKTTQLVRLSQTIRYYNEILTQSARNYIFTKDEKWKDRYFEYDRKLKSDIKKAMSLGDEKDTRIIAHINTANNIIKELELKALNLVDAGDESKAIAILDGKGYWAQKRIYMEGVNEYYRNKNIQFNKIIISPTGIVNLMIRDVRYVIESNTKVVIIFTVLALLVAVAVCVLLSRSIVIPLRKMMEGTDEIRNGNFQVRLNVDTQDELQQLSDSFNDMVDNLKTTTTSIENLNLEIHERKRIENELALANKDLESNEKAVRTLFKDLKKAHDELKLTQNQLVQSEKMAAVGQLCAGVAHEIKNPLAIILLSVCELESRLLNLGERDNSNIRMVKNAVEKANKVVIDLLSFSRYTAAELRPISLHESIDVALSLAKNRDKEKMIEVKKEYACEDKVVVLADQILLEQVFLNILTNAIDAIQQEGVITIKTYWEQVLKKNEERIVIEVIDNGCGISDNNLVRIFEPFFSTKEQGKGTGLGLSTSYMIIEKHDGQIEVESKLGEGTKITVKLPFSPDLDESQGAIDDDIKEDSSN